MIWYVMGFVLVLHVYLWGWGLTLLVLPRRWRRFWPAFCAPVGLALQSAVVWAGTHTALRGTDGYARVTLALPVALALAAVGVHRPAGAWRLLAQLRRWWAVALVMAFSLMLQAYPFTRPPHELTSIAMTSCDAADYAAGARVFEEFSRGDRTGYLGVVEPVRQLAVDNFYDFWLRINHFSPSALVALDASLFHQPPFRLVTLMGVVLLTLNLPGVFWLARSAFRFGPVGGLGVTLLYGVSPALFYAMYQVALGQLLAAPAIALLTWTGVQAFRVPGTLRRYAGYSGLMLVGNWLLLGSYNFFLVFAYVPLVAYVGLQTLFRGKWTRALRWAGFVAVNLTVAGCVVPERVISVIQRFFLFNKTPFGWSIPGFYPSGWYGAFADIYLHADHDWWSFAVTLAAVVFLVAAVIRLSKHHPRVVTLAAACTLPIFFGYWWLLREDAHLHDNASYDAYKLFAVFYPGILVSLCLWMRTAGLAARAGATLVWVSLLLASLSADARFNTYIRRSLFRVDASLQDVARLENPPNVASVNVSEPNDWDRLWSNYFLLRKPQYFTIPTYEGRPVTPPLGQWDLDDRLRLVSVHHPHEDDPAHGNARFRLIDRRDPRFMTADLGAGWYRAETFGTDHWCWSGGAPEIRGNNPHRGTLDAVLDLSVRSMVERTLRLCVAGTCVWEGRTGVKVNPVRGIPITLPPGTTILRLESPGPPDRVPGDPRALTFALYGLEIDVLAAR